MVDDVGMISGKVHHGFKDVGGPARGATRADDRAAEARMSQYARDDVLIDPGERDVAGQGDDQREDFGARRNGNGAAG